MAGTYEAIQEIEQATRDLRSMVREAHNVTERLTDRVHDLTRSLTTIALMDAPVAERERLLREFLRELAAEIDGPNTDEDR